MQQMNRGDLYIVSRILYNGSVYKAILIKQIDTVFETNRQVAKSAKERKDFSKDVLLDASRQ